MMTIEEKFLRKLMDIITEETEIIYSYYPKGPFSGRVVFPKVKVCIDITEGLVPILQQENHETGWGTIQCCWESVRRGTIVGPVARLVSQRQQDLLEADYSKESKKLAIAQYRGRLSYEKKVEKTGEKCPFSKTRKTTEGPGGEDKPENGDTL